MLCKREVHASKLDLIYVSIAVMVDSIYSQVVLNKHYLGQRSDELK